MAAGNNDENSSSEPLFKPLSAEDDSERPTEIESLCMECGENVGEILGKIDLYTPWVNRNFDPTFTKDQK